MPSHDCRKRILATDALVSVDGFRTMVHLTCSHLFGMILCCHNCPDCNCSAEPCQDMLGSNAKAEGGMFGRVDAVYTSIEDRTSTGSLHALRILKFVVQCLHQHTSLSDLLQNTSQAAWRHN